MYELVKNVRAWNHTSPVAVEESGFYIYDNNTETSKLVRFEDV